MGVRQVPNKGETSAKLSGKAFIDGALYRPSVEELRAYYSRDDVLNEFLLGMRKWRVRLEPGEGLKHRWFNVGSHDEIHQTLMRLLDRMAGRRALSRYPYFRIDGRRYEPVTSWEAKDLWGWDFIIEKDGYGWRE